MVECIKNNDFVNVSDLACIAERYVYRAIKRYQHQFRKISYGSHLISESILFDISKWDRIFCSRSPEYNVSWRWFWLFTRSIYIKWFGKNTKHPCICKFAVCNGFGFGYWYDKTDFQSKWIFFVMKRVDSWKTDLLRHLHFYFTASFYNTLLCPFVQ